MVKLIKKFQALSFQDKTTFTARFSIIFNTILAAFKIVLAFFYDIFLLGAGILNIFIMISKLQCYLGIKDKDKTKFERRNKMVALFLFLAGIQYALYLGRFIYANVNSPKYEMVLAIGIAAVSFLEMGIAIRGLFVSYGKGHYFRNIKIINLCSAMTAIVLTEIALTSFASETDTTFINGLFGIIVGLLISLVSIFIVLAPKFSIVDREYNVYEVKDINHKLKEDNIEIKLTNSKIYGNYVYIAKVEDNLIKGHIIKGKSPIKKWNIYLLILVIILSEILIFPYAIGALVFYFKSNKAIKLLDEKMNELGYKKVRGEEDVKNSISRR